MPPILLIIDMQQFFSYLTHPSATPTNPTNPSTPAAAPFLSNILTLASHFRSKGHPIIFTQHGHTPPELTPPYKNQLVEKWSPQGSIHRGSDDWELIPEIDDLVRDEEVGGAYPVVQKNTYDAFVGNALEGMLREAGAEKVFICGVLTDCCVDTTAKSAFNRGFEVGVVGDACATQGEKEHEESLRVFGRYYDKVVSMEGVLGEMV